MKIMIGAHSGSFIPNRYKHRIGNLFIPDSIWNSRLDFALDNGIYKSWKNGSQWKPEEFIAHLEKAKTNPVKPLWVVVPDAIADPVLTNHRWGEWAQTVAEYGYPLAFAAQDGHTPKDVPSDADLVFIGGSTEWKRENIKPFCDRFKRVHVGRINNYAWLWYCHRCGVESVDGTGWIWGRQRQEQSLIDYLAITEGERDRETGSLFPIHQYLWQGHNL